MSVEQVIENGYNLDLKNPNAAQAIEHLPPEQLMEDILAKERRIIEEIKQALSTTVASR